MNWYSDRYVMVQVFVIVAISYGVLPANVQAKATTDPGQM